MRVFNQYKKAHCSWISRSCNLFFFPSLLFHRKILFFGQEVTLWHTRWHGKKQLITPLPCLYRIDLPFFRYNVPLVQASSYWTAAGVFFLLLIQYPIIFAFYYHKKNEKPDSGKKRQKKCFQMITLLTHLKKKKAQLWNFCWTDCFILDPIGTRSHGNVLCIGIYVLPCLLWRKGIPLQILFHNAEYHLAFQ